MRLDFHNVSANKRGKVVMRAVANEVNKTPSLIETQVHILTYVLQAGLALDNLYCTNERTIESVAVWFQVLYSGYIQLKDGTLLEKGGFYFILENTSTWTKTTSVSVEYINEKRSQSGAAVAKFVSPDTFTLVCISF